MGKLRAIHLQEVNGGAQEELCTSDKFAVQHDRGEKTDSLRMRALHSQEVNGDAPEELCTSDKIAVQHDRGRGTDSLRMGKLCALCPQGAY